MGRCFRERAGVTIGYTHYWRRVKELPEGPFRAWADDVRKLISVAPAKVWDNYTTRPQPTPLRICGWDGTGEPEINADVVRFNGDTTFRYSTPFGHSDGAHETFEVQRIHEPDDWEQPDEYGRWFQFCKTAQKAYDLIVVAALIRLAYRFPEGVKLSSDGNREDWEAGAILCRRVFDQAMIPPEIRPRGGCAEYAVFGACLVDEQKAGVW